jgi:hypothetical protein
VADKFVMGVNPGGGEVLRARILLDGKPGTVVRSYDALGDYPGYDVDLDNGEHRWVSHQGSKTRMVALPPEQDPCARVPDASAGKTDATSQPDGDEKR